ncbi:MAG TPA: energy transducer TonB [Patescibacteria group bacterium]|nr:energy transducer TonB [Patescibacteria group bacterium]
MRRVLTIVAVLLSVSFAGGRRLAAAPGAASSPVAAFAPKFEPPEVLATADAAYPINSVAFGTVVLEVHLDATGEIEDVRVARGIDSLTKQALQAIKQWRFKPAMLDGKAVKSVVPVAFIFVRPDLYPRYGGSQARP